MTPTKEDQLPAIVQDSSNVMYVHPSKSAGSSITLNKTCFINGKIPKPNFTLPAFAQWERCDDIVTSWLLNSLSKDIADSLQYVNNSYSGYFTGSSNPLNHNKAHLFCDYCKKSGNTEEKCYRLHGFPQDFKFTKGRRAGGTTANAIGNTGGLLDENCENGHLKGSNHILTYSLKQDQYNQLLNLLGSIHIHGAGTSDGYKESTNDLNNAH
ncbi:hypothetical protein KY290_028380 [Solanum tuberosum]|uniref:Retrotransposon Copia-like N-terminal domain-containing protein n=1 Tax=Solanum tuberosum TaxID=4113 RepID=A0ABQ7UHR6_SOLTU|nr:hypothetical protein KY290_028380 [Solanum tuberosum]